MAHRKWMLAVGSVLFAAAALAGPGRPSREEMAADRAAAFAQADVDGDGALSPAEFETFHQLMRARMGQRWFARADTNGDGKVTLAELDAARPAGGCHHDGGKAPAQ
jgi:hypothetical protein